MCFNLFFNIGGKNYGELEGIVIFYIFYYLGDINYYNFKG